MASTNICIAISPYHLQLDNDVFDILRSKINQIQGMNKVLYVSKKYIPRKQTKELYAFLNSLNIQFFVKDTNYLVMLKSLKTPINFIILWSGKDDYTANLIINCQSHPKVALDYTIIDQQQSSLWSYFGKHDAIGITTNGFYVKNKNPSGNYSFISTIDEALAICGKGCAFQFRVFEPLFQIILGQKLRLFGNNVHLIGKYNDTTIFTFPVKPHSLVVKDPEKDIVSKQAHRFKKGDKAPGYICKARLDIIEKSLKQLLTLMTIHKFNSVLLPRVGCGNGELNWFGVLEVFKKVIGTKQKFYERIHIASFTSPPKPLTEFLKNKQP